MKTVLSIPDEVFEEAERLALKLKTSCSHRYSRALAALVARHSLNRLTEAMDLTIEEAGAEVDDFTRRAARRALEGTEW